MISEFERDIKAPAKLRHAEKQLQDYFAANYNAGRRDDFRLLATDGVRWRVYGVATESYLSKAALTAEEVRCAPPKASTLAPIRRAASHLRQVVLAGLLPQLDAALPALAPASYPYPGTSNPCFGSTFATSRGTPRHVGGRECWFAGRGRCLGGRRPRRPYFFVTAAFRW